jgi:hypothetical protein
MITMNFNNFRRYLLIIAAIVVVACAWYPPIQQLANDQIDAGFKRALISFTSARALNAAISVLQGTSFSVQPLGVGMTLTLGQVLHPINDLTEHFASLMLVATVAFGVQEILLAIGAHWVLSLLVSVAVIGWAVLNHLQKSPKWLSKLLLVLLMIRFAIPVVTIGSDLIFKKFMEQPLQEQQDYFNAVSREVQESSPQVPSDDPDKGWWEKFKDRVSSSVSSLHMNFDSIKNKVIELPERIAKVIAIFVLQTILLPIVLLWGLYKVVLGVVRPVRLGP